MCELICSAVHQGIFNPRESHITILRGENKTINVCTLCLSCVSSCVTEAITFNGKWLTVDRDSCISCGNCVDECPEGVIYLDNEGKAAVPDFCQGNPSCVEWCPHHAISVQGETE